MTHNMRMVLLEVGCTNAFGKWHRATGNGQRVTLAALYRCGELERRAWRKGKNSADDAYEYARPYYIKHGLVKR